MPFSKVGSKVGGKCFSIRKITLLEKAKITPENSSIPPRRKVLTEKPSAIRS